MRPLSLRSAIVALAPLLLLSSCNPATDPPAQSQAHLAVTANVAGTAVATVVVEVTASDITTPLVFNIVVASGVASGTITIPAGSNRTITIRAYDAGAVLTHSGTATVSVQAGTNPTVSLTLTPLTGDVPIEAHLGNFTINVTPTPNALSLAGTQTVQLTAAILDAQGHAVTGTVSWATHDPGIASVDATGLVTATGPGDTNVFATFQGTVGSAAISVGP